MRLQDPEDNVSVETLWAPPPFVDPNPILLEGLGVSVPEAHAAKPATLPKPQAAKPNPSRGYPS